MKKKALIITYYFPPAGGSGVQRWLYFVKYLRDFGIEPIVFTVENPKYAIEDKGLAQHIPDDLTVIRQTIFEPQSHHGKGAQVSSGFLPEKPSTLQRFKHYVRANYFIPDAKMLWVKPSVRKIKKYLKTNAVDWIISTGPPHTTHLIAQKINAQYGVKWLADFRDPWTSIDYMHHLPLTKKSKAKHQSLEHGVLRQADIVTVVSEHMKAEYENLAKQCVVITNGYDDLQLTKQPEIDRLFTLTHIGSINADRNPEVLWEVLKDLVDTQEGFADDLQINLVGFVADEVRRSILDHHIVRFVNFTKYIPNQVAASVQLKSRVLLLLVNNVPTAKTIVTGKVFEYLRAKRPILAIAPQDGDLAKVINQTNSGKVVDFNDKDNLKDVIINYYKAYKNGNLQVNSTNIEQYHRKNLTAQLAELLKNN